MDAWARVEKAAMLLAIAVIFMVESLGRSLWKTRRSFEEELSGTNRYRVCLRLRSVHVRGMVYIVVGLSWSLEAL